MSESSTPPPGDQQPEPADAGWLFREDPEPPVPPKPSGAAPAASGDDYGFEEVREAPVDSKRVSSEGGYALSENPTGSGAAEPSSVVPPVVRRPRPDRPETNAERPTRRPSPEAATVDQVWSRWAEWGPDLVRLGLVSAGALFLLFLAVSSGKVFLALLILLAAGAGLGFLGYPIFITLERPVRVTPEQAVKDYYGALSHLWPHYRRMWLLLSSAGRTSPPLTTFPAFKDYWVQTLENLAGEPVGRFSPLSFGIEDFRSDKSVGATEVDAEFTVQVFHRSRAEAGPIQSFRVKMGLVKGPDRMWYLNRATLPDPKPGKVESSS